MKFKVRAGTHIDEFGQSFSKGAIVESYDDLTITFPGKFEKLNEPLLANTSRSHGGEEDIPSQGGQKVQAPPFSPASEKEKSLTPPPATAPPTKKRRTPSQIPKEDFD